MAVARSAVDLSLWDRRGVSELTVPCNLLALKQQQVDDLTSSVCSEGTSEVLAGGSGWWEVRRDRGQHLCECSQSPLLLDNCRIRLQLADCREWRAHQIGNTDGPRVLASWRIRHHTASGEWNANSTVSDLIFLLIMKNTQGLVV